MQPRFIIRPDSHGYSVRDLLTGEPAVLASTPQTGLTQQDAEHTAELLNRRDVGVADPSETRPSA